MQKEYVASLRDRTYALVDVETSGLSPTGAQIIEIGIIRIEEGRIAATYKSLLKPERGIPPAIASLTGITNEELMDAPTFFEEALRIQELFTGAVFVAHNARFDYSFVKNEFRRIGMTFSAKTLCTVKLSRRLYPTAREHNLDALIARHGLTCAERHRAYDDAEVLWQFFNHLEETRDEDEVRSALAYTLGSHTLPAGLEPEIVKKLPHAPGVYIFYDAQGTVLYVGKSVDIRTRVLSHFSGDHLSGKELTMCRETVQIEHRETMGELSALLLESRLVKELEPVYNRVLRKAKKLAVARASTNENGYQVLELSYEDELDAYSLTDVVGIFRTVSQGRTFLKEAVREHTLCPKLFGFEKTSGGCFASQLGKCLKACSGKEDVDTYNERFDTAFKLRRIRSWPFRGPIVLKEEPDADEGAAYVIDHWRITRTISYSDGEVVDEPAVDSAFDYDTYKILSRHLLKHRKQVLPYEPAAQTFEEELVIA